MSDPWLTIIGIGEDGVAGLSAASQAALTAADVIMGPQRHLDLVVNNPLNTSVPAGTDLIPWPVPFADGIAILASLRGQKVAVLASGDPFWFGAGSVIARSFGPDEWTAIPGSSCFSLAAARLGWPLETTTCLGLHAAPFARLRPHLAPGAHLIVTLRDGDAVPMLGNYLDTQGFGNSTLHVMEHLGGPLDRLTRHCADAITGTFDHPVCVAIEVAGDGPALTSASGQTDASFQSDGQITKRPMPGHYAVHTGPETRRTSVGHWRRVRVHRVGVAARPPINHRNIRGSTRGSRCADHTERTGPWS